MPPRASVPPAAPASAAALRLRPPGGGAGFGDEAHFGDPVGTGCDEVEGLEPGAEEQARLQRAVLAHHLHGSLDVAQRRLLPRFSCILLRCVLLRCRRPCCERKQRNEPQKAAWA